MNQMKIRNSITGLTPYEAMKILKKKGYFSEDNIYPESQHLDDPAVITIVTMRDQIARIDYENHCHLMGINVQPAVVTHLPKKHSAPAILSQVKLPRTEHAKQCESKLHNVNVNVQLPLFGDSYSSPEERLVAHLTYNDRLYNKCRQAYADGDLPQDKFDIYATYFKQENLYLQGQIKEKPALSTNDILVLNAIARNY